jgi:predicted dehydrogenase
MVLRSGLAQRKDKVRLAVIGVADRGAANLAGVAEEEIVALCEIDEPRAVAARKQFPNAQFFVDYRVMFDKVMNKIDAVVISTPDHSHCLPALLAMAQKKHVYCEKPLAHTVQEVRLMQAAAARAKVITQMGTQIHAGENYRRVVEIVQSGVLGAIERVDVWCSRRPDGGRKLKPVQKVKFDPDLWCGPVDSDFFYATHANWPHFHWRWWWEFGGGVHADMGCHFTDLAHWALNLGAPISISAEGQSIPNADNGVPWVLKVDYMYPKTEQRPAIPLTWYHGVPGPDLTGKTRYPGFNDGVFFTGSKAKLVANYSKYQLLPEEFAQDFKAPPKTIPASIGHHREWLEAIRGNGKALCDFGYSGTLAEAVLLGNVAYRSGGKLTWDTNTGKISGGDNPDAYLSMTPRQGWEYPKI